MDNIVTVPSGSMRIANYTRLDTKDLVALVDRVERAAQTVGKTKLYTNPRVHTGRTQEEVPTLYFVQLPTNDRRAKRPRTWNTVMPVDFSERMIVRIADLPEWPADAEAHGERWRLPPPAHKELTERLVALWCHSKRVADEYRSRHEKAHSLAEVVETIRRVLCRQVCRDGREVHVNTVPSPYEAAIVTLMDTRARMLTELKGTRKNRDTYMTDEETFADIEREAQPLSEALDALGIDNDLRPQWEELRDAITRFDDTMFGLAETIYALEVHTPAANVHSIQNATARQRKKGSGDSRLGICTYCGGGSHKLTLGLPAPQLEPTPTGRFRITNVSDYNSDDLIAIFADVEAMLPDLASPPTQPPLVHFVRGSFCERLWGPIATPDQREGDPEPVGGVVLLPTPAMPKHAVLRFVFGAPEPMLPEPEVDALRAFIVNRYIAGGYAPADLDAKALPARTVRRDRNGNAVGGDPYAIERPIRHARALRRQLARIRTNLYGGSYVEQQSYSDAPIVDSTDPGGWGIPHGPLTFAPTYPHIVKLEKIANSLGLTVQLCAQVEDITQRAVKLEASLLRFSAFAGHYFVPAR
jgi:hypothetical protein